MSALVEPRLIAPPALEYLPGGVMELHVAPAPRWPVANRNVRALHGLVTNLLGVPHTPMIPRFALMPWPEGIGWAVYVSDPEIALRVAGRTDQAEFFRRPVLLRLSPMRRVPAPRVVPWAPSTVVLRTITPVCIRESISETVARTGADRIRARNVRKYRLDPGNLLSTIATWLPDRLGLEHWKEERSLLSMRVVLEKTRPALVPIGGKFRTVQGWEGEIVMCVCPASRWLLEAAQTVGLGGRTALGFGRIRVYDA